MARFSAPTISRDSVLFVVGIGGIIYETVKNGGDQPTLLILFGAMVGLPAFLHVDESRKKDPVAPPDSVQPTAGPPTKE